MVRLESFGGAEGIGASGRLMRKAVEGRGGLGFTLGDLYRTGFIPMFIGEKFMSNREGFDW